MARYETFKGVPRLPHQRFGLPVVRMRRAQLLVAGCDELSALRLATDPEVDVHAMIVMKEQRADVEVPAGTEGRSDA